MIVLYVYTMLSEQSCLLIYWAACIANERATWLPIATAFYFIHQLKKPWEIIQKCGWAPYALTELSVATIICLTCRKQPAIVTGAFSRKYSQFVTQNVDITEIAFRAFHMTVLRICTNILKSQTTVVARKHWNNETLNKDVINSVLCVTMSRLEKLQCQQLPTLRQTRQHGRRVGQWHELAAIPAKKLWSLPHSNTYFGQVSNTLQ